MSKKDKDKNEAQVPEAEPAPAPEAAPAPEEPKGPTPEELLAAEKDRYTRLYAEYENYRKRSVKEREALYAAVKSDTVTKILPIYDNLERALKLGCSDEAFLKGIEMTMEQFKSALEILGVKPIEAVGQPFDVSRHSAVMHVDDESLGASVVVEEFQKGFVLGDKVIRFSQVKVAN